MGKTEKGAIWLDKNLLSPYNYWQFWRNTDDRDVIKFLKMFTDIDLKKIDQIKDKDINELKIILANEATSMLHGKIASIKAHKTAKNTFEIKSIGEDLPSIKIKKTIVENGINLIDLLVISNLFSSKSEVRRTIKNRGIKINNEIVDDEKLIVSIKYFNKENLLKLSHGKKKHIIINID